MSGTGTAGDDLWFLNTWVSVRIAAEQGTDSISVLEHRARQGDSPPLHLHQTEDELFQVLEGRFTFRVADSERGPGTSSSCRRRRPTPTWSPPPRAAAG